MTDKKLLFSVSTKDLDMQTFRSGGPGGQNQNKRETGVRFIHAPSGARGESREHREQLQNKKAALKRLTEDPRFTFWVHQQVLELEGKETAEAWVDEQMKDQDNFKFESKDSDGRWVEYTPE